MTASIPTGRVTSSDVARRAGVSRATVSTILNGHGTRFHEETRDRVRAAATELGYRPSHAGRALVKGTSDIAIVLIPNTTFGPHMQDGIDRMGSVAAEFGLTIMVRFVGADTEQTLQAIVDLRPSVVVDLGALSRQDVTVVEASGARLIPSLRAALTDEPDVVNLTIGREQVEEVLSAGVRRIVYASLADQRLDPFGPIRYAGCAAAASERGLPLPAHVWVPLDAAGAIAALTGRLSVADGPIAVCCYNDDVAIAVLAAVRSFGYSVPEQVSVIGADFTRVGQLVSPRLTTIAIDFADVMTLALRELAGEPPQDQSPLANPREYVRIIPGETT